MYRYKDTKKVTVFFSVVRTPSDIKSKVLTAEMLYLNPREI